MDVMDARQDSTHPVHRIMIVSYIRYSTIDCMQSEMEGIVHQLCLLGCQGLMLDITPAVGSQKHAIKKAYILNRLMYLSYFQH